MFHIVQFSEKIGWGVWAQTFYLKCTRLACLFAKQVVPGCQKLYSQVFNAQIQKQICKNTLIHKYSLRPLLYFRLAGVSRITKITFTCVKHTIPNFWQYVSNTNVYSKKYTFPYYIKLSYIQLTYIPIQMYILKNAHSSTSNCHISPKYKYTYFKYKYTYSQTLRLKGVQTPSN